MSSVYFYYDPTIGFDRLFEDPVATRFCPRALASSTETKPAAPRHRDSYRPRLDLHESKDTNLVTATLELPGLTVESVSIEVQQNRLTVSGESPASRSDAQQEGKYVVQERRTGKFSRTVDLPLGIKLEDVKAKMENGILTITFPRTSPDQEPKRIVIQ